MASLRDSVREYLGLARGDNESNYSLAQNVPGNHSARMSQLYGYELPNYENIPPSAPQMNQQQQYQPPPPPQYLPPPTDQTTYPPPPVIQPVERKGSVPPAIIPPNNMNQSMPTSQCAAPNPHQTPGIDRPAYAVPLHQLPHGRGRGKGRERARADSKAPTLGRGLAANPALSLHSNNQQIGRMDSEVESSSSGSGDENKQGQGQGHHHHHHHRHYHRHYDQNQQQQQQQQVQNQPQVIQQPIQLPPEQPQQGVSPVIVINNQQPQIQQPQPAQVGLYVHGKDVTQRRKEVEQPVEFKPYFILGVTILELAIYIFELIKTDKISSITFGSNPWQWGGCDSNVIIDVGGKYAPYILHRNEWWRFFTPIFMHVSLPHIIMNFLMQLKIGISLEKSYGAFRIGAIYLICGIGANLVSSIFLYTQIQAGASGALFGFMGILLVDIIQNWKIIMNPVRNLIILIISIVISIAFGMLPGVDNFAHMGGFVFGIISGFVILPSLAPAKKKSKWSRVCTIIVFLPILTALLIGLFVVFYKVVGAGHYSTEWCSWCSQINCASAILGDSWCKSE